MSQNKSKVLLFHSGVIITAYEIHTEEKKRKNKTECHELEKTEGIVSFVFPFFLFFSV